MKYKHRPLVVEAIQFTGTNYKEVLAFTGNDDRYAQYVEYEGNPIIIILTIEGDMLAPPGYFVVKNAHGEFYPMRSDIFKETYEVAEQ